ncbi:hypothetical protein HJC23_006589 [Cyclotella cryptica]|uniref:Uncharacterized protein n=1 Tax=Cyclotella cryptica TaxID=29204 RepID=A0ABD3PE08_9STRA
MSILTEGLHGMTHHVIDVMYVRVFRERSASMHALGGSGKKQLKRTKHTSHSPDKTHGPAVSSPLITLLSMRRGDRYGGANRNSQIEICGRAWSSTCRASSTGRARSEYVHAR